MATDLFEQINQVWNNDAEINSRTKAISVYMTNRFISLHPAGFTAANDCNSIKGLPDWAALLFLKYATPKMRAPRMKYPKSLVTKPKLSDKRKNALSKVCRLFNVKEEHGFQILNLLEKQGLTIETY